MGGPYGSVIKCCPFRRRRRERELIGNRADREVVLGTPSELPLCVFHKMRRKNTNAYAERE